MDYKTSERWLNRVSWSLFVMAYLSCATITVITYLHFTWMILFFTVTQYASFIANASGMVRRLHAEKL